MTGGRFDFRRAAQATGSQPVSTSPRGRGIADRAETTIAATPAATRTAPPYRHALLSAEWFAKWTRSSGKFPADLPAAQFPPSTE